MNPENKQTPLQQSMAGKQIPREPETEDIRQGIRRVSSVPTDAPRNQYENIVLYVSGATYRLYVYDPVAGAWRYATLT